MSKSEESCPKIQQRIGQISIGASLQGSPSTNVTKGTRKPQGTPDGVTPDSKTTAAGGRVKGSVKRQSSRKLLRHVSFSEELPGEVKPFESRGRMGSISGDLDADSSRIPVRRVNVLLLYTGGALGWKLIPGALSVLVFEVIDRTGEECFTQSPNTKKWVEKTRVEKNLVLNELKKLPMMHDTDYVSRIEENLLDDLPEEEIGEDQIIMPVSRYGVRTFIDVKEMASDMVEHSQDMDMKGWINIALKIKEYYDTYHGFVILHGTDTLCYTASALSFMFENLGKSVVITGSLSPINEHLNDGRDNILGAVMLAGHHVIPEVSVYFHGKLYRGNRCLKVDSRSFGAFDSPNFPPIATVESGIEVEWDEIFRCNLSSRFTVRTNLVPHVGVLRLFPGITIATVKTFLQPPIQGVVLETYGSGNGPDSRQDLMDEIQSASSRGVIFVNCTQCLYGSVVDSYATGKVLLDAGVIPGADMTVEAALSKLSYVLGLDVSQEEKKQLMRSNLRGELTEYSSQEKEQFSLRDNELIGIVASNLKVGSCEEVRYIKQALFPVLMCSAAASGDVKTIEDLCKQAGSNPNCATDHDGRTPLHIACTEGHVNVVRYLLLRGASPHVQDKYGQRPVDDAISRENEEIIELLIDSGAHLGPTTMDMARRLCQLAAENKVSKLKAWHLAGADLNVGDYDGRTPLHVAVCRSNVEAVQFLLQNGANMNTMDVYGQSALDNAKFMQNEEILSLLNSPESQMMTESIQ